MYKSLIKPRNFTKLKVKKPALDSTGQQFVEQNENVYFVDLYDKHFFAEAPFYKDSLIYIDESHINLLGSKEYGRKQGPKLAGVIRKLLAN